ncbi:hypothetical protein [Sulfuricurvum sp.]|uniref:hypothetical protein n=1 Tax=Sulfuricurvum sp. TaxID=2025608 RepID=UPI00260E3E7F|nr:hypothetical protein [Sulfuricurvum sp.]MDD2267470.1 hypothetical protein [Sulfuricurvum sp.]MDD2782809.1 hypothetical protein [Sulfuricurvum sp.]
MVLTKSFYRSSNRDVNGCKMISDTLEYRSGYMSEVFYKLYKEEINAFTIDEGKRGALLYIGGASEHHSHTRVYPTDTLKGTIPIKAQMGYMASKIAGGLGSIEYLSINANACASGMFAIHEAYDLIHNKGFDEVIIYGEEWAEPNEQLLYTQLKIPVTPSDGFVILKFAKSGHGAYVNATTWVWHKERSAFDFSQEGYECAMRALGDVKPDIIKIHGTGTEVNDRAELGAVSAVYGTSEYVRYKDRIGHSQGVSGALELAMAVEEYPYKTIVCNAAGLGNFYGAVWVET